MTTHIGHGAAPEAVLVVVESFWGNTRAVADAVARGLGDAVTVLEVAEAPATLPADVGLLVVGGPTHAFSMSRPGTREDAEKRGAPDHPTRGIREWLEEIAPTKDLEVATFDTRVTKVRKLPGSAARAAAKEVRHRHLGRLLASESFYVDGIEGPLLAGELDRAEAWGARLTGLVRGEGR